MREVGEKARKSNVEKEDWKKDFDWLRLFTGKLLFSLVDNVARSDSVACRQVH